MTKTERTYLDWNATAPLPPAAREAVVAALDMVGNPSSVHGEGRALRMLVEAARQICPYSKATRGNIEVSISVV